MIRGKSKAVIAGYVTLACAVVFGGVTAAYLTHYAAAANTFVVGSQISSVHENWSPPAKLVSGKSYVKAVRVMNKGTVDCYVRVMAELTDPSMGDKLSFDWNSTQWTEKQKDGYYYYKWALPAGGATLPLFNRVTALTDTADFEMIIYEETVQAAGCSSPQEAFGS